MRINPLNLTLIDEWAQIETLDAETAKNNLPSVVFKLDPMAVMLVTMDLRSLMASDYNWVYGEDWAISFTVETELSVKAKEEPKLLPEQLLKS